VTESGDKMADALKAIDYMENYFKEINMPTNLRELGIDPTEEEYRKLAESASYFGKRTLGSFKTLTPEDMYNIFKAAR
jgi:alcohol dehydrogenase YqhD (iron-dependent ADH family)